MQNRFYKELLIKTGIFFAIFVLALIILAITKTIPNVIKEITGKIGADIDPPYPFIFKEWIILYSYRTCVYFAVPVISFAFESIFRKSVKKKDIFLTNIEAQFLGFSIFKGAYYLLSLDYVFKNDIFSIQDSLIFVLVFVFTIVFDKRIPLLFANVEETIKRD